LDVLAWARLKRLAEAQDTSMREALENLLFTASSHRWIIEKRNRRTDFDVEITREGQRLTIEVILPGAPKKERIVVPATPRTRLS